ncbi:MAG: SDR family oxidoreductase [Deltaproteobacteria bacterium]|nr:SDR family oxidoreductase [Deltaproteobacteria bacterium]
MTRERPAPAPGPDLTGQVAIVTGATRGIGAAISRSLLEAGAAVHAIYARDEEAATRFCDGLGPLAERVSLHALDVAEPTAVESLFAALPAPPQILVNNAGIRQDALVGLTSLASWERVLAVNLTGAFHLCKLAVRAMLGARYGRIVSLTSPSGHLGLAGQGSYAASKAGLTALSRCLALEVATRGITVNCVCPGLVETDLVSGLPAERLAELTAQIPLRRAARPEEIASAVLYLVSPAASYVTGTTLFVTGGLG